MTVIQNIAYAFPAHSVSNEDWKRAYPDWDFDRLVTRTGVVRRHVTEGETALDFAVRACEKLAVQGSLCPEDIGAIIFCTQSPDYIMPPNACLLHGRLGLKPDVLAFDINLACSGYIYGLQIASSLLCSAVARRVLLATADTYTRYIHPGDRATRCLFGDGGAVTIIADSGDGFALRDIQCGTAGKHYEKFMIPAGGMREPRSDKTACETVDQSGNRRSREHIKMDGLGVLSFFNATVPGAVRGMLSRNDMTIDDIDLFVFHQASQIALDGIRTALQIPMEKMIYDLAETGNLVSASIPVAVSRAFELGRARHGQRALFCGFGVGLSWGTAIVDL